MNVLPEHLNFDEICRSCMTKKDRMRPLFGSSLDSMLMAVANVTVSLNDGYPAQMCVQCVLQVSRAFTFKQQCEKTDITLKQYLSRILQSQSETVPLSEDKYNVKEEMQLVSVDSQGQSIGYGLGGHNQDECVLILSEASNSEQPAGNELGIAQFSIPAVGDAALEIGESNDNNGEEPCKQIKLIASFNQSQNMLGITSIALDEDIVGDDHFDQAYGLETNVITFEINDNSNHYASELMSCEHCQREFKSSVEMKDHTLTCMTMAKSTACDPPSRFEKCTALDIVENSPIHDSWVLLRFQCNVCRKRFSNSSKLRRHSRTHLVDKPHVCNICGMSFAESSNLTKHHRKHTGELRNVIGKPNLCSVCGKRFKWATSLSKHMKHHTKRKLFTCPYPNCNKYYVEQRSLDIHIYSHDGKKPFTCNYCSKGFTQKCNLEKHERVHTGEKPYKCNICHKSFAQSGYLVIHQRIHSQEKPYNCDECGKQFTASNALTVHMRSHSGERPYACDLCSKRFSRQETLSIHKSRKHTNDPSQSCTICTEKFATSEQLTEHLRSQHGDRCYHMCPSCGKVFASMQSLKNHQKVHLKEGVLSDDRPQPMIQFVVDHKIVSHDSVIIDSSSV